MIGGSSSPLPMLKLGGEAAIINIAPAAAGPIHQTILRSVGLSLRRVQDEFSSSLLPVAPPGGVAQWVRKVAKAEAKAAVIGSRCNPRTRAERFDQDNDRAGKKISVASSAFGRRRAVAAGDGAQGRIYNRCRCWRKRLGIPQSRQIV
jgi:hypothetical protein